MEVVRTFLDSSTIHGLGYISRTRNFVRIIWILIILAGFSAAGILIYQSFQEWEETPVETVIETLPITDLPLPKVTVCPPKNTFTNLNFDLMMLDNITLHKKTRTEMIQYAVKLIQNYTYRNVMSNISVIEEENRYYNWYMGYTSFVIPFWGQTSCNDDNNIKDNECNKNMLRYTLDTYATSGNISTQFFDDEFDHKKIDGNFRYMIYLNPPEEYENDSNVTLCVNIQKNILKGVERFYNEEDEDFHCFSPPGSYKYYS